MASIFFDTCAIEALIKKNISGNQLKAALYKRGRHAVIGRNTLYECAKNFNNPEDVNKKYSFIEELDPEYTLISQQYYQLELKKLNNNISFFWPWSGNEEKNFITKVNFNVKNGFIDSGLTQYHEDRNKKIEYLKNYWKPKRPKLIVIDATNLEGYKNDSLYLFIDNFDQLHLFDGINSKSINFLKNELPSYSNIVESIQKKTKLLPEQKEQIFQIYACKNKIQYVPISVWKKRNNGSFEDRIKCLIEYNKSNIKPWFNQTMNLSVTDENLEKILECVINKFPDYRALQCIIRTNIYLAVHSFCENARARRDRFEDALQLTEAAYCTTFVSDEKQLVKNNGFGYKINPFIELLSVEKFLECTPEILEIQ